MKNCHFSKRVNKWFLDKNGHFCNFFILSKIGQENVCYDILERKNPFLGFQNKKFKKSKNFNYSKWVNPLFLYKKWPFFQLFFLGNIEQQNVFYDILERKNACLRYKNKKFKTSKNWHFPKGVNPWFWSKNSRFSKFFLFASLEQENVFYDILKRKNAFLGYKNKKFKKSKNWKFFQRD